MRRRKVIIDFSKIADGYLDEFSAHIVKSMTGNPDFPSPVPAIAEVSAALIEYKASLVKSLDGAKQDTAEKNLKRSALLGKLSALARYVNDASAGNEAKLVGSGFPLAKLPSPIGTLDAPEEFFVGEAYNPGEVFVKQSANPKTRSYIFLYTLDPPPADNSKWQVSISTRSKTMIRGLESGKKYWFKAAAASSSGTLNFSEPVSRIVQ